MERSTLEWFDLLARALIWAAGIVLVLSVIGAITVASSDSSLPFFQDVQREGRTIAAIGAVGAGIAAAGVLSGLGAILRLLLVDRLERTAAGRDARTADPRGGAGDREPGAGAGAGRPR